MKKHAILFDLDGTLVDTIELIMTSMEFTFRDFDGPRPGRDVWLEGLGIPLRTQLAAWARTPAELDWLVARYRVYQSEHHDRMTVPYPGVTEVLDELRAAGYQMALVTSKFHALATRVLRHVEFVSHFDSVVGADSILNPKPHPDPVFKALSELGRRPEDSIFVGDSPHDIRSGNAAGVATAAALWGPFSRDQLTPAQPTYWVSTIHDLPPLIAAL